MGEALHPLRTEIEKGIHTAVEISVKLLLLISLPPASSGKQVVHMEPGSRTDNGRSVVMNICGDIVVVRGIGDAARTYKMVITEENVDAVLSSIEIVD